MSTLRTKNMELTGLIDIGEDGGSVSLYKNGEEYIIHRYAARGKVENWVSNYEMIDGNNNSKLLPIDLEYGNKILDRVDGGENYSNVFIFYGEDSVSDDLPTEKSLEEHTYTSTGIKFWRHSEAMFNYKNGNPNTVISNVPIAL